MIIGEQVKDYLVEYLGDQQAGKSSHWQEFLTDFSYSEETGLAGLRGFGELTRGIKRGKAITRLYHWLLQSPYKIQFGNYIKLLRALRSAKCITSVQDRLVDLDVLIQVFTFVFCADKIPQFSRKRISLVIGDGFGTLSSLLYNNTSHKIICVNLNEVLLVDYLFTRGIIRNEQTVLAETAEDLNEAIETEKIRFICLRADNHELLKNVPIDIAFNTASMQEMTPQIIGQYFSDMRECKSDSLYFYCCNRIEKLLPDGTTVKFSDYPWDSNDEIIVDGLCPWHQYHYRYKLPFYFQYDGPHQHRLVKMK
jgi:putative sugar O-methyltransferase